MQNIFSIVLFQSYTYTSCFRYGPSCFWSFFWHLQNEIRKYICLPMEAYLSPGRMSEVNWPYSVRAVSDSKDTCMQWTDMSMQEVFTYMIFLYYDIGLLIYGFTFFNRRLFTPVSLLWWYEITVFSCWSFCRITWFLNETTGTWYCTLFSNQYVHFQ